MRPTIVVSVAWMHRNTAALCRHRVADHAYYIQILNLMFTLNTVELWYNLNYCLIILCYNFRYDLVQIRSFRIFPHCVQALPTFLLVVNVQPGASGTSRDTRHLPEKSSQTPPPSLYCSRPLLRWLCRAYNQPHSPLNRPHQFKGLCRFVRRR